MFPGQRDWAVRTRSGRARARLAADDLSSYGHSRESRSGGSREDRAMAVVSKKRDDYQGICEESSSDPLIIAILRDGEGGKPLRLRSGQALTTSRRAARRYSLNLLTLLTGKQLVGCCLRLLKQASCLRDEIDDFEG